MRKSIVIAVSLLFVVASAFAQQAPLLRIPSPFSSRTCAIVYSSSSGTRLDASYGAAFDHMFNKHLSAELSVTSQQIRRELLDIRRQRTADVFIVYSDTSIRSTQTSPTTSSPTAAGSHTSAAA